MKNKELFDKTIKKLKKAFFNDSLNAGGCSSCALGVICGGFWEWRLIFYTRENIQVFNSFKITDEKRKKIREETSKKSGGYLIEELARIENAFEINTAKPPYKSDKEKMNELGKGLNAVLDVLIDIHQIDEVIENPFCFDERLEPLNK